MFLEYLPHMACLFGGTIIGFGICAVLTAGKVADLQNEVRLTRDAKVSEILPRANQVIAAEAKEARKAHARATDALNATRARIERALEQVRLQQRPNATVQRIARILSGEQA